jgi:antitoxin component of MazEF toxin-antitoxin module
LRPGLALKAPARLHAVEIAIDVELEQDRWMIGRPTRRRRGHTLKAEIAEIKPVNKDVDGANRIVVADPIVEALRQQRRLAPIRPGNEPLHRVPPDSAGEP